MVHRIGFISEDEVYDIPWADLSGQHFWFPGWWDNTVVLYSHVFSRDELQVICDRIQENCFIDGEDWEDYETDTELLYEFPLSDMTIQLQCIVPSAFPIE